MKKGIAAEGIQRRWELPSKSCRACRNLNPIRKPLTINICRAQSCRIVVAAEEPQNPFPAIFSFN